MSVITAYFLLRYSSLLRINQRHHSLRTRLWYTPPAAVKTEKNRRRKTPARARSLGVGVGRDSRYVDRSKYVCPPSPPETPRGSHSGVWSHMYFIAITTPIPDPVLQKQIKVRPRVYPPYFYGMCTVTGGRSRSAVCGGWCVKL